MPKTVSWIFDREKKVPTIDNDYIVNRFENGIEPGDLFYDNVSIEDKIFLDIASELGKRYHEIKDEFFKKTGVRIQLNPRCYQANVAFGMHTKFQKEWDQLEKDFIDPTKNIWVADLENLKALSELDIIIMQVL